MSKPIFDPMYWKERLKKAQAKDRLHHSVFICGESRWIDAAITAHNALCENIKPNDSVLDVGCAYGGLLDMMPEEWLGDYLGIDICPEFIKLAQEMEYTREFRVADARYLHFIRDAHFDVAVLRSIKGMVLREMGQEAWDSMESELCRVAKRLLIIEY